MCRFSMGDAQLTLPIEEDGGEEHLEELRDGDGGGGREVVGSLALGNLHDDTNTHLNGDQSQGCSISGTLGTM